MGGVAIAVAFALEYLGKKEAGVGLTLAVLSSKRGVNPMERFDAYFYSPYDTK